MRAYTPRPIRSHGILSHNEWTLKQYSIHHLADGVVDLATFDDAFALALAELPHPAVAPGRAGAGFMIAHRGNGCCYAVLGWWDRENELPLRVFVRDDGQTEWRMASGGESVCVWDLQVVGFERQAWIDTMLAGGNEDAALQDYMQRYLNEG